MSAKIKINKGNMKEIICMVILLFTFIQQRTYTETPQIVQLFFKAGPVGASLVICCISIKYIGILKKQKYIWLFAAFWAVYIFTTFWHSRAYTFYVAWHALVYIALVVYISIKAKTDLQNLLSALSFIYGAYIYLNFILDILFPNGLYTTTTYHTAHLLGDDNALIYVILPGLVIMTCNSLQKHNKVKAYVWIAILISEITLFNVWSASALVCLTMFIVLLVYTLHIGRLDPRILLFGVIFAIALCLFGLTSAPVQSFVTNVLHKDVTLHDRTYLWAMAFSLISEHLVWGLGGYFQNGQFQLSQYSTTLYPSHTTYLQVLIDGGLILFTIFCIAIYLAYKNTSKRKRCLCSFVLAIGLSCMLVNYITEYSEFHHLFIMITLMMNIDSFNEEELSTAKISFYNKRKRIRAK